MESVELKRFKKNTYAVIIKVLVIFGTTGIIGGVIGKLLDNHFETGPKLLLISLGISYIIGWLFSYSMIIKFYKKANQIEEQLINSEE
jgi:F0F1-type ATP synthase assembly protein I